MDGGLLGGLFGYFLMLSFLAIGGNGDLHRYRQ